MNIQLNKIDNTKFGQDWRQGKESCSSCKNYSKKNMVSVIIPTYNRGSVITDAIDSVLGQTYQQLEIIVVDDGSHDNTISLLEQYNGRIKYIYQNNAGPGLAKNNGIKHASGKYIAFCDSDDLWEATKLEEQVYFMEQNKDYALCCTDFRTISGFSHKKIIQKSVNDTMPIKNGYVFSHLLKHQYIKTSTLMLRTEILQHTGMFHEKLMAFEDRYLWFNIARRYKIFFLNRILATVRIQDDNITNNQKIMYNNFIMLYNNLLSDNKFTVAQKMRMRREIAKRHFNMAYSERIAGNLEKSRALYLKSLIRYPKIWTIIAYFRTFGS